MLNETPGIDYKPAFLPQRHFESGQRAYYACPGLGRYNTNTNKMGYSEPEYSHPVPVQIFAKKNTRNG